MNLSLSLFTNCTGKLPVHLQKENHLIPKGQFLALIIARLLFVLLCLLNPLAHSLTSSSNSVSLEGNSYHSPNLHLSETLSGA